MSLFHKLKEGILVPGLCLFGDNAYLNTPYKATPYAAVLGGTKDSYNFYHLQLQIRIECTFGRSAIPMNITIQKTVALVMALAKLHNYCINVDDGTSILHPLQMSGLLSSMVLYRWLNLVIPTKASFLSNYWMVETILMMLGATLVDTTCSNSTTTSARRMAFYYHVIDYTPIFCLLVSPDQHRYVVDNNHNNISSSL
jgi:hypothetical protein